jgi:hypothetical protein
LMVMPSAMTVLMASKLNIYASLHQVRNSQVQSNVPASTRAQFDLSVLNIPVPPVQGKSTIESLSFFSVKA